MPAINVYNDTESRLIITRDVDEGKMKNEFLMSTELHFRVLKMFPST